jgi:hypothetical protein
LDEHKTPKESEVDILSPERQLELQELLNVVLRFRPNKLVLEAQGGELMKEYRAHQRDRGPLGRNEHYQIGFNVMDRMGLDTLYAADADPLMVDLYMGADSLLFRPWLGLPVLRLGLGRSGQRLGTLQTALRGPGPLHA